MIIFPKIFVFHISVPKVQDGSYLRNIQCLSFKNISKMRIEKISFDRSRGSLIVHYVLFVTLLKFEIFHNNKEKQFPNQIQRLTLLLGGEKLSQVILLGQEDWRWNGEACSHVSRVGGLSFQESRCTYHLLRYLQELVLCLLAQAVNKDSRGGGFAPSKGSKSLQRSQVTAEFKSHVSSLHQYRGVLSQPQFLKAAHGSRKHPRPGLPWWSSG